MLTYGPLRRIAGNGKLGRVLGFQGGPLAALRTSVSQKPDATFASACVFMQVALHLWPASAVEVITLPLKLSILQELTPVLGVGGDLATGGSNSKRARLSESAAAAMSSAPAHSTLRVTECAPSCLSTACWIADLLNFACAASIADDDEDDEDDDDDQLCDYVCMVLEGMDPAAVVEVHAFADCYHMQLLMDCIVAARVLLPIRTQHIAPSAILQQYGYARFVVDAIADDLGQHGGRGMKVSTHSLWVI